MEHHEQSAWCDSGKIEERKPGAEQNSPHGMVPWSWTSEEIIESSTLFAARGDVSSVVRDIHRIYCAVRHETLSTEQHWGVSVDEAHVPRMLKDMK